MTYAIGHIVFGLNLTAASFSSNPPAYDALKNIQDDAGEYILSEHIENETGGFQSCYSGGGDAPQWFGLSLGEIDECRAVNGADLIQKLTATDSHKEQYEELIKALEANGEKEEFVAALRAHEPQVWILWGSS